MTELPILHLVWFRVKLHVKDAKTILDKKKYVAFWLERYAKKEPGMPLTVVFDMTESGISNIVSPQTQLSPTFIIFYSISVASFISLLW